MPPSFARYGSVRLLPLECLPDPVLGCGQVLSFLGFGSRKLGHRVLRKRSDFISRSGFPSTIRFGQYHEPHGYWYHHSCLNLWGQSD